MARTGRPPVPTKLKMLRGNPGKRPLPKDEPKPAAGVPTRPEWLSPEAKRQWTRLVADLPAGLLTRVDRMILAATYQAWADYVEAVEDLHANGWSFKAESGYEAPRPSVAKMHKALEKIITLSGKLGLSPADRTRLSVPDQAEEDPFKAFLKQKTEADA